MFIPIIICSSTLFGMHDATAVHSSNFAVCCRFQGHFQFSSAHRTDLNSCLLFLVATHVWQTYSEFFCWLSLGIGSGSSRVVFWGLLAGRLWLFWPCMHLCVGHLAFQVSVFIHWVIKSTSLWPYHSTTCTFWFFDVFAGPRSCLHGIIV